MSCRPRDELVASSPATQSSNGGALSADNADVTSEGAFRLPQSVSAEASDRGFVMLVGDRVRIP